MYVCMYTECLQQGVRYSNSLPAKRHARCTSTSCTCLPPHKSIAKNSSSRSNYNEDNPPIIMPTLHWISLTMERTLEIIPTQILLSFLRKRIGGMTERLHIMPMYVGLLYTIYWIYINKYLKVWSHLLQQNWYSKPSQHYSTCCNIWHHSYWKVLYPVSGILSCSL